MPICSRILEDYTNGLHIKKTNKSYFKKLRRSFVKIKYKKNYTITLFLKVIIGEMTAESTEGYYLKKYINFSIYK